MAFAWQAWHLRHWAGSGDALGRRGQPWHFVTAALLCGRRGTWLTSMWLWRGRRGFLGQVVRLVLGASIAVVLCVAGVGFGDIRLAFVQQAWHLVTSTWLSCGRSHTTLAHNFVAHNSLSRTRTHTLVQLNFFTQVCHTQLFHTRFYFPAQLFVSQNSFTHTHTPLSHTQLFHTHTQRCHMQRFSPTHTRTHTHSLSVTQTTFPHTTLSHTTLAHNQSSTIPFVFPASPIPLPHLFDIAGRN